VARGGCGGRAVSAGADEFVAKWQARWPEWGIGAAFVPAAQRDIAFAWFALLQELTDAAWSGADATPGLAKLAWWNEELQGWAKGARRHPLGEWLQSQPAPWTALAAGLLPLQASRERSPATDPAQTGLDGFARAVVECEQAMFGSSVEAGWAGTTPVVFDLLAERQLRDGEAGQAARLLGAVIPANPATTRPRRLHSAFLKQRLRSMAAGAPGRPPAPWRSLWHAWRAARAGR